MCHDSLTCVLHTWIWMSYLCSHRNELSVFVTHTHMCAMTHSYVYCSYEWWVCCVHIERVRGARDSYTHVCHDSYVCTPKSTPTSTPTAAGESVIFFFQLLVLQTLCIYIHMYVVCLCSQHCDVVYSVSTCNFLVKHFV